MVGNISSASVTGASFSSSSTNQSQNKLTLSQQETISSVLSEFDSENITEDDAASIVSSFQEAGLKPSKELAYAMESLGFDAKEIGKLGGAKETRNVSMPPPPPPTEEEQDSISELLDSLLATDEDESTSSFDDVMEYTSRIMYLNDESKTEVMSMLDEYSPQNTEFSQEETSQLIKNSLSEILGNSANYNRLSLYA